MVGGSDDAIIAVDILEAVLLSLLHEIVQLLRGLDGGNINAQGLRNVCADEDAVAPVGDVQIITGNLGGQDIAAAFVDGVVNVVLEVLQADDADVVSVSNVGILRNEILDVDQHALGTGLLDDAGLASGAAPVGSIDHVGHIAGSEHHVQLLSFAHHEAFELDGDADLLADRGSNVVVVLVLSGLEAAVPANEHLQLDVVKLLVGVAVLVGVDVALSERHAHGENQQGCQQQCQQFLHVCLPLSYSGTYSAGAPSPLTYQSDLSP